MFREKTCEERNAFIELINGCRSCLDPKHQLETCKWASKNRCSRVLGNGDVCGEPHHELLHEDGDTSTENENEEEEDPYDEE